MDAEEIAAHLQLDPRATTIFLTALTNLGLLTRSNDQQYYNSPLSNQYLVKGRQGYIGDFNVDWETARGEFTSFGIRF